MEVALGRKERGTAPLELSLYSLGTTHCSCSRAAKAIQGKEKEANGKKQEYFGRLEGPFPTEAAGSFQGLLVKATRTRVDASAACRLNFAQRKHFTSKTKKVELQTGDRTGIPEQSPPNSIICS